MSSSAPAAAAAAAAPAAADYEAARNQRARMHVPLRASHRTLLHNSRLVCACKKTEVATLTIRVRSKGNMAELEEHVRKESLKPAAKRKYLSVQDITDRYGANAEDLDEVEAVATEHNLTVVHRHDCHRVVMLRGTLGDLMAAFPANVGQYEHPTVGAYRAQIGEVQIPSHLDGIVTGVFGYDTRPRRRGPPLRGSGGRGGAFAAAAAAGAARPRAGDQLDPDGVPATVFAKRYNFPTQYKGKTLDGKGQTIAIVELGGGYRTSDIRAYFTALRLPIPTVTAISVDHARNAPSNADSADGEVMLDIEVAAAVVPKAKFAVYFGTADEQGFLDVFKAAVFDTQRKPSVISVSWGGSESVNDQGNDAFHELFVQAAAQGITICVASGDHGTANETADVWDGRLHVDHPSSDDMVLSCGGTQINAISQPDVVWNDGTTLQDGGWATGGGISTVFGVPTYQQQLGNSLPVSLDTNQPGRGVPDIAMCAYGYLVRVDGVTTVSGGTSAVAPLMSALVAKFNQAKSARVGFLNPALYSLAASVPDAFFKVTEGTNAITDTTSGYSASPDTTWNACTGLGIPNGDVILQNLP